jgi:hypothetical protein
LAAILGYSVCRVFEKQGFIAGKKDKRMKDAKERHGKLVDEVAPDLDLLDYYCEERTKSALKIRRTSILSGQGMKYDTFFDKDGNIVDEAFKIPKEKDKEIEARNRAKRKALKEAIKAKVTALTSNSLTGNAGVEYDPFYFGMTQKQFARQSAGWDVVSKLITGGIFGYYGIKMLQDPDWGYIIWTSVQAATFLVAGGLKYLSAFLFIVEDTIDGIVKKMDNLQKFKNVDKMKYKKEARENVTT